MGIFEQILEANKVLSEQLTTLSSDVLLMKEQISNYQNNDKLILEFSNDETLNTSMTARVLGIKQTELDDIIQKGLLHSVGKTKRIFRVKDVLDYLKYKEESEKTVDVSFKVNNRKKKKRKASKKSNYNQNEIAELIKLNKNIPKSDHNF